LGRLKFGRREIEGDSANPEQPVLPDWGQLNSIGIRISVPGDGWPFRVSEGQAKNEYSASANRSRCGEKRQTVVTWNLPELNNGRQPIEVGVRFLK
jgi:hypothetical protein